MQFHFLDLVLLLGSLSTRSINEMPLELSKNLDATEHNLKLRIFEKRNQLKFAGNFTLDETPNKGY